MFSLLSNDFNFILLTLLGPSIVKIWTSRKCLAINPITAGNFAALLNCMSMDRALDSMMPRPNAINFSCFEPELSMLLVHRGSNDDLSLQISSDVLWQSRDH